MRLAFIKKRFSISGGAEKYLQTLIGHLKKKEHEIHIFSNEWPAEENIISHKIGAISFNSFLSVLTFNRNLKKTMRKNTADCVISFERTTCQDIYRAGEGCHAEWLEIRSKIESFYKNISFKISPLHITLLNLEKKLFAETELIIANSKMVKDQITKHYPMPEQRITTIYNGVDLARFTPENKGRWRDAARKLINVSEDFNIALFVGSGFERKGLGTLLKAVALMKRENIRVLVIGKGETKKYKKLAEVHGVSDRVIFLGPRSDIEKFYTAADLFVLPTLYDPFSNATLEAMASGLPVITTENNGAAELVEKGNEGFVLANLFDADELADKIELSLNNLRVMGERARKKAECFSIERAVGEFMEAINRVCL